MWLYESGELKYEDIGGNSTSWGNYYWEDFEYYATAVAKSTSTKPERSAEILPTGAETWPSKRNSVNNICDLAGNMEECTQEARKYYWMTENFCRATRGSSGGLLTDVATVDDRSDEYMDGNSLICWMGCRVHLIIS